MSTVIRGLVAAFGARSAIGGITVAVLMLSGPSALAMDSQTHEPQLQLGKYGAYVVVRNVAKVTQAKADAVSPRAAVAPVSVAAAAAVVPTELPASAPLAPPVASDPDLAATEREAAREAAVQKQISQLVAAASLANAAASQSSRTVDQLLLPVWLAAIGALISAFFATRSLFENRKSLKSIRARLHTMSSFQKV